MPLYSVFDKVLAVFGLSVGRSGVEITVADENGRLHQLGVPINSTAAQIDAATAPSAADVPIADAGGLYTAADVEDALAEIAGAGRTVETVKSASDDAATAQAAADAAALVAGAAYVSPAGGIPAADMDAAVQASLGKADAAMQASADVSAIRIGTVTLNGANPTPVNFQADTAASLTSALAETYDLTGIGDGGTIIIDPDGNGNDTATINFTAGTSVSGAAAPEDIHLETDSKFMIAVDGDAAEEVVLNLAACDTGAHTATEMQTKIQALGGNKANVTVGFAGGQYTITSGTYGTGSSVVITDAVSGNICEELKIGVANGGVETAGTGDVVDASVATAAEIAAVINTDIAGVTADGSSGSVVITSNTTGSGSSLVLGAGTLNAVFNFPASDYGAVGLGYASDMANNTYKAVATLTGTIAGALANKALSVNNKTASGFDLVCQTAGATDTVDIVVLGQAAA